MNACRDDSHGQVMGVGELYHFYKCNKCGDYVSRYDDPGRWTPSGKAFCGPCTDGWIEADAGQRAFQADVPAAYAFATYQGFGTHIAKALARWPDRQILMGISGGPGRGKTHAVWATVKRLAQAGRGVLYLDCDDARGRWASREHAAREDLLLAWVGARLLVLDDLTRPVASEGWASVITRLIDSRVSSQSPTILTTMDSAERIEELYGAAMRSRLSAFEWVVLSGRDRRGLPDA